MWISLRTLSWLFVYAFSSFAQLPSVFAESRGVTKGF